MHARGLLKQTWIAADSLCFSNPAGSPQLCRLQCVHPDWSAAREFCNAMSNFRCNAGLHQGAPNRGNSWVQQQMPCITSINPLAHLKAYHNAVASHWCDSSATSAVELACLQDAWEARLCGRSAVDRGRRCGASADGFSNGATHLPRASLVAASHGRAVATL